MRVGVLSGSGASLVESRVAGLKMPLFAFSPTRVQELTNDSADVVYLIPFGALREAGWNGLRVRLAHANRQYVIVGHGLGSADFMRAARDGAADVLEESDNDERWRAAITRSAENQTLWLELYGGAPLSSEEALIGLSSAICALRATIKKIGPTDVNTLILGESGVGKERVARALHDASGRKRFVALNCAAIPRDLLEAELFGVEKGAYTGALKSRSGLVEQAAGGTLFLDEIGEMDAALQPKLLRFLETRIARRVGGENEYRSQARIVAATNRELRSESTTGQFRSDLFFRLAEVTITIPPLRERAEDIPPLVMTFLGLANERFGKHFSAVEPALLQRLKMHLWPGNARELKSAIDRMVLLYDGPLLRENWWDAPVPFVTPPNTSDVASQPVTASPVLNRKQKLELARRLLAESENNFTWVAGQLGVNSSTLWRWRKAGDV